MGSTLCSGISKLHSLSKRFVRTRNIFMMESPCLEYTTSTFVHNYETAVATLNSLQSNATVLEKARLERDKSAPLNIPQTIKYLNRVGITIDMLDEKLPVIHVSGTKGKGSTCAFCETILRYSGLKTGFYSSPHLIEVRERIRLNGQPISKDLFAMYFWELYSSLISQKEHEDDMPAYFKFLTVMAYYVFIKEKVEAAVVEVGIGGLYDCSNVFRKPVVVGITSLGLDHTSILGDTVEKIAIHKAGIMKTNVPAFTIRDQPGNSLKVLVDKANEIKCPLYIVPDLEEYQWSPYSFKLGLDGEVQLKNVSLALQLSYTFLNRRTPDCNETINPIYAKPFRITSVFAVGLSLTRWPGRSQIIRTNHMSYFIDGAHTPESIDACVQWFKKSCNSSSRIKRILIFNATGDRKTSLLLSPLLECNFNVVIFCPNIADESNSLLKDQINLMVTKEQQLARCESNRNTWLEITTRIKQPKDQVVCTVPGINSALQFAEHYSIQGEQVDVLITGSLHLVGGVLSLLDPELTYSRREKETERHLLNYRLSVDSSIPCAIPGTP